MRPKNMSMSRKGAATEQCIIRACQGYFIRGIATIDKVETSLALQYDAEKQAVSGVKFKKGPKVDFRGTLFPGRAVSLEVKESEDPRGLPLAHFRENQIEYMKIAVPYGEVCMAVVYMKPLNAYYRVWAADVLRRWDHWRLHPGERGVNGIPLEEMEPLHSKAGIILDFLTGLYDLGAEGGRAEVDAITAARVINSFR